MGTKEFKDILICNEQGSVNGYRVRQMQDGKWFVTDGKYGLISTKVDIILDWLVDEEVLEETRFRLTAHQKSILRTRIWEWIGCGIGLLIIEGILVWMMLKLFIG